MDNADQQKNEPTSNFDGGSDAVMCDWNRVRGLIEHEDDLIDQRMDWLLTINGFLLSAFLVAQPSDLNADLKTVIKWSIPVVGLIVSFAIKVTIGAAVRQIRTVVKWWQVRLSNDPRNVLACLDASVNPSHPPIVGLADAGHLSHDFMIAGILPVTIISIWIGLLILLPSQFDKVKQVSSLPGWALVVISVLCLVYVWKDQINSLLKRLR